MTYKETIKSSFELVHKNWQLILIQLGMMILSCITFFIFVGIPLAVALVVFGVDFTELTKLKDLLQTMSEPSEILSKYLGLFVVLIISFVVYLFIIATIGLYVFGGTVGVLSRAIKDRTSRFSMNIFFSEGRRLFFQMLGFTAVIGLVFMAVTFVLGIFGGLIAAVISMAREQGAAIGLFIGIFFSLLLFFVGLILIAATIALTLYGAAAVIFKGLGAFKATKETIKYLFKRPDALWLYCIAFLGYILASFMLMLIGTPFSLIPLIGSLLMLPYQLLSYMIQSYLGLVILTMTFLYYYSTEVKPKETPEFEIEPIANWVNPSSDTYQSQDAGQEPPRPEKDNPE